MDQTSTSSSRNAKTSSVMYEDVDTFDWIEQQVVGILIYESEVEIAKERANQVKEMSSINEKIIAMKKKKSFTTTSSSTTDLPSSSLNMEILDFNEKFKRLGVSETNLAKFRFKVSTNNTHHDFEAALKETKEAIMVRVNKSSMAREFKRLESKLSSVLLRQRMRSSNEEGDNEDLCSICLKEMAGGNDDDDNDELKETCCDHVYHSSCLTTWLERNYTCPLCRYVIS